MAACMDPSQSLSELSTMRQTAQNFATLVLPMSIAAKDLVPFTQARATLSELADEIKQGNEKSSSRTVGVTTR